MIAHIVCSIVFVHGLQGHPYHSWTHGVSAGTTHVNKPRSKVKFWRPSPIRNVSDETAVYWPLDLLPQDFPRARIITFGYDSAISHWFSGPAMQADIPQYGQSLLNGLEMIRRQYRDRPLVLVAHSLGGLILKDVKSLIPRV